VSLNDGAKEVENGEECGSCAWFAYFQYFRYNFTDTLNALRKDGRHEAVSMPQMDQDVPLLYF